ncbi:uncharacterized protein [Linepithema humile]|uniref:uncharacterized protein isoform X2 n=1 Tax=Linepithema humile TaxID=83485 RepID=UPI00351DF62C
MLSPEEANKCVSDTQETYYEGANEDTKEKTCKETQNTKANESQDFHLMLEDESMRESEKIKQAQDKEATQQKPLVEQLNVQQIPDASQLKTNDEVITTNNKETKNNEDKKSTQNEAVKEAEGNISDDICDSKKKDELSDEDEIIQGTPFQDYSPKAVSNIDVTSLKRKAGSFEEPLAKVPKTLSQEDTANVKKRCEEEENRQSCESDNSYEDLFKDIEKNVIIEETQDVGYLELTQNCLKNHPEHAAKATNDKVCEPQDEQINQQQTFPEIHDVEKDENLNLSTKITDTSANDSIVVNMNSIIENDSRTEDNSLSLETKENIIAIVNEGPKIEILNEINQSIEVKNTKTVSNESNKPKQTSEIEIIEKISDNEEIPSSQTNVPETIPISRKSRTSIEVIYDSVNDELRSKGKIDDEVQIEDDGVKIVDSSAEVVEIVDDSRDKIIDDTSEKSADDSHSRIRILESLEKGGEVKTVYQSSLENKTCSDISCRSTAESAKESSLDSKLTMEKRLVNGSTESKRSESTDATLSVESDTNLSGCETPTPNVTVHENATKPSNSDAKSGSFAFKDPDNNELLSISDHDSSNTEDKNYLFTKILEREVDMYLKLKCLIIIDEKTKECMSKELIAVQCEPTLAENSSAIGKQKNEDSQGSLADISDNRDSSPGSVNTNPQLFQLPSRLSMMSTVSSSSSASSAASLAARLALKNIPFPIPVGPAKHARKTTQEGGPLSKDKQALEEICDDRMTREWKNQHLLTTKVLNYANAELFPAGTEACINVSNERLDDHHHHLQKSSMRSSTPEAAVSELELAVTPKSTKKGKAVKRARSKITKSTAQTNGENDNVPSNSEIDVNTSPSRKKSKLENDDKLLISDTDVLANSSPQNTQINDLVGKIVFAKWSDKNYYPGTVIDRVKTKYKVNFYDGKSKLLIPEFVIPILKTLREGLSVYATTGADDYGSCGIIVDVQTSKCNADDVYYTVATDEGERLRVQIHDISLSADQALVLKEEMDAESKGSLPSTPKAFGQVTLDNMVDGKRRSKRIGGTPSFLTPKSRSNAAGTSGNSASKIKAEPSVSGVLTKLKKNALSENESMSSDSNIEVIQDEYVLRGVQHEINGTPYEQRIKGSQNKVKSKPRSKKRKNEDPQINADLGPIPPSNSNIFKDLKT